MEEVPVKLELLAPSMNEFIGKLQNLNNVGTAEKSAVLRTILISVENLRNNLKHSVVFVDNERKITFNNQVERAFNEFNWDMNYSIKTYEFEKFINCCKSLAGSIMKILGKKNCCVLIVEMHFQICIRLINELQENIEHHNLLKSLLLFQLLVKGYLTSMKVIKKFWYNIVIPEQKCSLMLCLNQSFKTLCFLGKIIDKQLASLMTYLLRRLKQCIDKIIEVLFTQDRQCSDSEFIMLMVSCLKKLDQLSYEFSFLESPNQTSNETLSSLKPLLDELICHAMVVSSIANIEADSNLINIYSQKVLNEYHQINNHIADTSGHDILSRANKLSETLCYLEQIVNTAILNIVLDVFVDINEPLKQLVNKCNLQMETFTNKTASDLENEISSFDEHMDKIMHIGLFAVSCSTDIKRIVEIRSCLASLESLQTEIITSIISLYLHPSPAIKKVFNYLFCNWIEEITQLKNSIDLILDPATFCQIVEKRIRALISELRDESVQISKINYNLSQIIRYTKKLIKTLLRCSEYGFDQNEEKMKKLLESLRLAFQECEASYSLLSENIPPKQISARITKRANLIVTAINMLINHLIPSTDITENQDYETKLFSSEKIKSCENFLELKQDVYDVSTMSQEMKNTITDEILTPYINKGKSRIKERTILYTTPKNAQHCQDTPGRTYARTSECDRLCQSLYQHPRSRFCRPPSCNVELQNSLDLELTFLLGQVTDLSNTFKPAHLNIKYENEEDMIVLETINNTFGPVRRISDSNAASGSEKLYPDSSSVLDNELQEEKKVFLGTIIRQKLNQSLNCLKNNLSLTIDGDDNRQYETPERMHDLTVVQQKINFLRELIND